MKDFNVYEYYNDRKIMIWNPLNIYETVFK